MSTQGLFKYCATILDLGKMQNRSVDLSKNHNFKTNMKKTLSFLVFALLGAFATSAWGQAYDFTATAPSGQTLYYKIVNGEAHVVRPGAGSIYNNYITGSLTIPSTVSNGNTTYAVTALDTTNSSGTFYKCTGLTSVTIPNSVTSICKNAFSNCSGLTSITIPNSVTSIGYYAFNSCSNLTSVNYIGTIAQWCNIAFSDPGSNPTYYTHSLNINGSPVTDLIIPDSVTSIGNYAFYNCSSLTSVTIPNSVTSIGDYAFNGCSGLTSVTIPNSVTSIGDYAFNYCTGLTSVSIPNSVTSISAYAFFCCFGLTSVTIPNSVNSIGYYAFNGCSSLTSVNYIGTIAQWCNIAFSDLSSNPIRYAHSLNINGSPVTDLIIPDSVTSIGNYAFDGCSSLTSVTIPNSVTSIGNYAFEGCSGLTSITIGSGVTSIGNFAFKNCSSLTSVTIPNSVTSIGHYAFYNCSSMTSITIGNGVISIGDYAFDGCSSLTYFNYIGTIAQWCNIAFSQSYSNPIYYTHSLSINGSPVTNLIIPDGVTSIGNYAFYNCSSLTSVTIPNSVTFIGYAAFYHCSGLTSATIGNGVTSIGNYAFDSCSSMTSITIGSGVTSIGNYAFYHCSGLTSVTIPDSVTSIGNYAFNDCSSLTSITIPNSVTTLGSYSFENCSSLTSATIGNGVTFISSFAFTHCSSLTSVTFGSGVTSINFSAFSGCLSLTSVTIPNSVTSISDFAFYCCRSLTSVTIPNSVTSIGDNAFSNCSGTTFVTIGSSVSSIGYDAFAECYNLDTVYMMPTIPPTLEGTFVFSGNASGRVFILNGCSYNHYYYTLPSNPWYSYRDKLRHPFYDINVNVMSSDSNYGTATVILGPGDRVVRCDSTVVVEATANTGCHFDHWSSNSTNNPDTVTLTGDSTITAYFALDSYNLTINVNDDSLGSVATPQGTSALYQDTLMVVATPIAHHHVVDWEGQGIVAISIHKDTVWVKMDSNLTVTCNFAIDTHTVEVQENDITRGMVQANGTQFAYGTLCTLTATAYTGYTFTNWSNGLTTNPYTFAVLEDVSLTAVFLAPGEHAYTVTVNANDTTMGSVSGGGTYEEGRVITLEATPNAGYHFVHWNDDVTEATRNVTVKADIIFTAYFESDSTEGIEDVCSEMKDVKVYAKNSRIVVVGATDEVRIYDITGRNIATSKVVAGTDACIPVYNTGVYLVKVGNLPTRKVVVIR